MSPEDAANGQVFPHISNIRMVSRRVAVAVIEEAIEKLTSNKITNLKREQQQRHIKQHSAPPTVSIITENIIHYK